MVAGRVTNTVESPTKVSLLSSLLELVNTVSLDKVLALELYVPLPTSKVIPSSIV